ncbi:tetratricopeptide repeat-containing sensor histidine kinase [Xanthocytophaga flava]|uniref:tetratricopeptide repeat-containing sensor histidine kinase n=1 Tax=Xanthocytophaga flava TaxID=3048013 RepID=UPI0028D866FE|nr:sensor histidine kinase [Xanthocytophaga flavus]MDJ1473570.1 sensor histidine kinase [Xanthocytophaga flavus]
MRYLLLLCIFSIAYPTQAQLTRHVPKSLDSLEWFLHTQPRDSLYIISIKNCGFQYMIRGEYNRADSLINILYKLKQEQPAKNALITYCILFLKGTLAYHKSDKAATLAYYLKAEKVIEQNPTKFDPMFKIAAPGNIAAAYRRLDKLDMSMKYSLKAIKIQEKYHQESASEYQSIGNILSSYRQYDRALPYYRRALQIGQRDKDVKSMAITENLMGNLYDNINQADTAIIYYRRGLLHAEQCDYALLQTDLLVNLGRMLINNKNYTQAEIYLKRGEKLSRELEAPIALRINLHNQAEMYREMQKFDLAEKYYLEGLAMAQKSNDFDELYKSNQALAELYSNMGKFEKSVQFMEEAAKAKDSTFHLQLAETSQQLLAQYESEKRQQEIALLNEKNRSQSLELAVQRRNVFLLIAGLLLTGIAVIVGYRRYRLHKRLEMERIRNRIAADFHDELGANLSSIALYSDLLLNNHNAEKERTLPILTNISQQAHTSISSINDLIWTIKPDNDALGHTFVRMKEFAYPLLESRNIVFVFVADDPLVKAQLDMNIRKFLYLIFKEAINNIAKYAQATSVTVQLRESKGWIHMEIADDGIGFDQVKVKRGNGLNNMQTRAHELGGKLTIDSQVGQGTKITLSFKISA